MRKPSASTTLDVHDMTADLGNVLREAREQRGLSPAGLAERCSVPEHAVASLEAGDLAAVGDRRLAKACVRALGRELDVDAEALLLAVDEVWPPEGPPPPAPPAPPRAQEPAPAPLDPQPGLPASEPPPPWRRDEPPAQTEPPDEAPLPSWLRDEPAEAPPERSLWPSTGWGQDWEDEPVEPSVGPPAPQPADTPGPGGAIPAPPAPREPEPPAWPSPVEPAAGWPGDRPGDDRGGEERSEPLAQEYREEEYPEEEYLGQTRTEPVHVEWGGYHDDEWRWGRWVAGAVFVVIVVGLLVWLVTGLVEFGATGTRLDGAASAGGLDAAIDPGPERARGSEQDADESAVDSANVSGGPLASGLRPPEDTPVQVLDGSGDPAAAEEAVAALEDLGYEVVVVGRARTSYVRTTVFHSEGWEGEAAALGELDGRFARVRPNDRGLTEDLALHIVVGEDWAG